MYSLNYNQSFFLKSFSDNVSINIQNGIEIAFFGYSNSGKSSTINSLTKQKKLARFSKNPGRTQLINFFEVVSDFRIVDLPGYGYANVSSLIRSRLQRLLYSYCNQRNQLKGIVLIMDIRYPLKILDYNIINIAHIRKIPMLVLLNKCDKITVKQRNFQFNIVKKKLNQILNNCQIEIFSSRKNIGINHLELQLNLWYKKYCF